MEKRYVEKRDAGYWVTGTRVSLDSIVLAFLDGLSPESIATECFPVLTLEQVYRAITYYLALRAEIDRAREVPMARLLLRSFVLAALFSTTCILFAQSTGGRIIGRVIHC